MLGGHAEGPRDRDGACELPGGGGEFCGHDGGVDEPLKAIVATSTTPTASTARIASTPLTVRTTGTTSVRCGDGGDAQTSGKHLLPLRAEVTIGPGKLDVLLFSEPRGVIGDGDGPRPGARINAGGVWCDGRIDQGTDGQTCPQEDGCGGCCCAAWACGHARNHTDYAGRQKRLTTRRPVGAARS